MEEWKDGRLEDWVPMCWFPLEKRMETNARIHKDYAPVKHLEKIQIAENGGGSSESAR